MAPPPPWLRALLGAALALVSPLALAEQPPNIDPAVESGQRQSKDAALIIGIEGYAALPQVTWAVDDAKSVEAWAKETRGLAGWRTRTVADGSARDILKEARRARYRVRRGGTLWVYFAGHGTVLDDGRRVVLGVNARGDDLSADGVLLSELLAELERTRNADRIVVLLDAGFGNIGRDGLALVPGRTTVAPEPVEALQSDRTLVWAASADSARAPAYVPAKHGLFTWVAMGALRGWADGELDGEADGHVTVGEAQAYAERVTRHLGSLPRPTLDDRLETQVWVLDRGAHLEPGPDDALLDKLAAQELQRRIDAAVETVQADARAFWQDTLAIARQGGPAGEEALEAYIAEFSRARATVTWAVQVPEVREARQVLLHYDELGVPDEASADAVVEPCDDLLALESAAMLGQLTDGQRACLDQRIRTERLQTDKNKISRMLLVHAEARKDRDEWRRLMERHLEDIDRSDPDLCFAYALYLHRTGDLEAAEEVVRWAAYALENKQAWEGDAYVRKVTALLRLQTEAAHKLWRDADERFRQDVNPENEEIADTYRGWAKEYSKAWVDYARAAGEPADKAMQLCLAASGTSSYCTEERAR